jgi:hypothetical protein
MKKKVKDNLKKGVEKVSKVKSLSFWKKIKNIEQKHKVLFFLVFSFLLVIFLIFGARLYLFVNFLLGHDTLVKLTADKQDFFLENGQSATVKFDTYVSTNFFCEAECSYSFEDLSMGYILDKGNFTTKIANPNELEYTLVAPEIGEGQKLYLFEVSCFSRETPFCKTGEKVNKRSYLVALNYELSDEQKKFKEEANESLQKLIFEYDELKRINLENEDMFDILSDYIKLEKISENDLEELGEGLDLLLEDWKNYEYEVVLEDVFSEKINKTRNSFIELNENLTSKFFSYNEFVLDGFKVREEIYDLTKKENISEKNYEDISSIIENYNSFFGNLSSPFELQIAKQKVNFLFFKINETLKKLEDNNSFVFNYSSLVPFNLNLISKPFYSNYSSGKKISVEEPMCCYKGDCNVCCAGNCWDDSSKYPIILVHGHSFNDKISADSSLGDLNSIKDALVEDGVVDGGYVIIRKLENTGTFARTNRQIVFAASYYFDIYQNEEETLSLQAKADSLDTYALRLNDIVENVKLMTNRKKVNIVAHSMGGLVSRRYLQIFGDESIDNLVMIGTPNYGIDGYVLSSCPVFGAKIHCDMMDKNSLFINKLNFAEKPDINVSVIIGLGCNTDGSPGDGIVKNESAYLPWAENYFVEGNCSGVDFFHRSMVDVEKYPEVYEYVKKGLGLED